MPGTVVRGTGMYVPPCKVANERLSHIMDTSDEWIQARSGIKTRYYVEEGVATSDLAVEASKKALADAGMTPADVDYVVFATMTPDYYFPGSGGLLQTKLGLGNVPALDIRQQCSGFVYGMQVSDALLATGEWKTILFVGAEIHSGFMPWKCWDFVMGKNEQPPTREEYEWNTKFRDRAVLFGDGAGALVLQKGDDPKKGLLGTVTHVDGKYTEHLFVDSGGFKYRPYFIAEHQTSGQIVPSMDGRAVFKMAATKMPEAVREVCAKVGVTVEDIDMLLCHQANLRICEMVQSQLKLPDEKVYNNIQEYANTTAATIPILLDEVRRKGLVKEGSLICFASLGAGFHWGAALMRL